MNPSKAVILNAPGGAPPPPAWDPADYAFDNAFWTEDTANVYSNGAFVPNWNGYVGAVDLTDLGAGSAFQPTWETTGWNGAKPSILFGAAGGTDFLAAPWGPYTQPCEYLIVFQQLTVSAVVRILYDGYINDFTFVDYYGGAWTVAAGADRYLTSPIPNTSRHVMYVRYDGANTKWWVDGTTEAAMTGATVGTNSSDGILLGCQAGTGAGPTHARFACVAVKDGTYSDADRNTIITSAVAHYL